MKPFAVLSDVNANFEALTAVMSDVVAQGIDDLIFLGDAVGYGPNPVECIATLREKVRVYLSGRLEFLMTHRREDELTPSDREAVLFSSEALFSTPDYLEWLRNLPPVYTEGGVMAVHSNPRGREYECLLLDNIQFNPTAITRLFSFTKLLFVGDNHQPWILTNSGNGYIEKEVSYEYRLGEVDKAIISVGSVGQPRDSDPRACYVIVSGESVTWRRVEYDINRTVAKIEANPRLAKHFATRLRKGI